jgi:catechol 2,3-dioxygenase-like lactoylglutathione lyase family enzyme
MHVAMVALLVREYDEAIAFYRDALGFTVAEDTPLPTKRWVRMAAPAPGGAQLLLSRAVGDQAASVGKQAGGRVLLFLHTQTFDTDVARLRAANVELLEERTEPFGRVVVFADLYGNRLDLIERR